MSTTEQPTQKVAEQRYYIVNRMSGKTLAGPFTRYVDAFNARAPMGAIGMVVER